MDHHPSDGIMLGLTGSDAVNEYHKALEAPLTNLELMTKEAEIPLCRAVALEQFVPMVVACSVNLAERHTLCEGMQAPGIE